MIEKHEIEKHEIEEELDRQGFTCESCGSADVSVMESEEDYMCNNCGHIGAI